MRLNLKLTANKEPVPFNHLHWLTGFLHDRIGQNALHDGLSLYSFGWLQDGTGENGHLTFPQGAAWRVSFHDAAIAKRLLDGIMSVPEVFCGMRVYEVKEQAVPQFSGCYHFETDGARTRLATIEKGGHATRHKGSVCPVVVKGPPEAVQFAWQVGVGELTGSGFGALR